MGTKIANIHIQTTNLNEVVDKIKTMKLSSSYYVGAFGNWVSVFGAQYDWGNIGHEALALSSVLKHPILSVGYFDDDIVEIALFQENQLITKHVAGEDIEEYFGLEKETLNIKLFKRSLNLSIESANIASILNKDDLEEIVDGLGDVLELPLWNKYDWIEDNEVMKEQCVHIKRKFSLWW